MNKSAYLQIRISDADKEALKQLAESKQMTMSEMVVYLIRRESEKSK